jgi:hypothetical protein
MVARLRICGLACFGPTGSSNTPWGSRAGDASGCAPSAGRPWCFPWLGTPWNCHRRSWRSWDKGWRTCLSQPYTQHGYVTRLKPSSHMCTTGRVGCITRGDGHTDCHLDKPLRAPPRECGRYSKAVVDMVAFVTLSINWLCTDEQKSRGSDVHAGNIK